MFPGALEIPMQPTPSDDSSSLRPHLTVVFAIVIVWIAGRASAETFDSQLPCCGGDGLELVGAPPIQFDAQTMFDYPARIEIGPIPEMPLTKSRNGKPVSVDLNASLANLDADSDPDGWRAQVVIRDRQGQPGAGTSQCDVHVDAESFPR